MSIQLDKNVKIQGGDGSCVKFGRIWQLILGCSQEHPFVLVSLSSQQWVLV